MIVINGDFLCRNLTGIERFAYEITMRLDKIVSKDSISILIPQNAKMIPNFANINGIVSNRECKIFPVWEHFVFGKFVRKNNFTPLDFSNVTPFGTKGIVFIHDIYAKLYGQDFVTFKEKLIKFYMNVMYHFAIYHSKKIFTVSEFSKKQILENYKIKPQKIDVIPNGWDHFKSVQFDDSILDRFNLQKNEFYFTLGSLSKRKNLRWIAEYAQNHQTEKFAISGKMISGLVPEELAVLQNLKNVILLGYVTDEEVKSLMSACKAFIFPSYYEGFGIPPLEALSCGAKIIVAKSACLPEIYENCAHYIEQDNSNIDLEELLKGDVKNPNSILEKYTYDNAAKKLSEALIGEIINKSNKELILR